MGTKTDGGAQLNHIIFWYWLALGLIALILIAGASSIPTRPAESIEQHPAWSVQKYELDSRANALLYVPHER